MPNMTMTHMGVCTVRGGMDVRTKNELSARGLEVAKAVNSFSIAETRERLIASWFQ